MKNKKRNNCSRPWFNPEMEKEKKKQSRNNCTDHCNYDPTNQRNYDPTNQRNYDRTNQRNYDRTNQRNYDYNYYQIYNDYADLISNNVNYGGKGGGKAGGKDDSSIPRRPHVTPVDVCVYILSDVHESVQPRDVLRLLDIASTIWSSNGRTIPFNTKICDFRERDCDMRDPSVYDTRIDVRNIKSPVTPQLQNVFDIRKNDNINCSKINTIGIFIFDTDEFTDGADGKTFSQGGGRDFPSNITLGYNAFRSDNLGILAHELGHAFGLDHLPNNTPSNLMNGGNPGWYVPSVEATSSTQYLRSLLTNEQRTMAYTSPFITRLK